MTERTTVPAPWQVHGSGFMFLYRFERDFIKAVGGVDDWLLPSYTGGLGAVVLVSYTQTPVGSYHELAFIPGFFRHGRKRYLHTSCMYVTSAASAVSGQANWGIPKQTAEIEIEDVDVRVRRYRALKDGQVFFMAETKAALLRFPFNSFFSPLRFRFLHQRAIDGARLAFEPSLGGVMSLTGSLETLQIDGTHFPDVSSQQPLAALELVSLRMTVPSPYRVD